MQGLGHMFARSVKVSMEDMRQRQFSAANAIMSRQQAFLQKGRLPDPHDDDTEAAPLGDLDEGLDEQSMQIRTIPLVDGDKDEPGKDGQLRLRRTIQFTTADGAVHTRVIIYTNREDIFSLNSCCEKWVRWIYYLLIRICLNSTSSVLGCLGSMESLSTCGA
jgi:hypothetical protein